MTALTRLLLAAATVSTVVAVDLGTCNSTVTQRLKNRTLTSNDPIFYHDDLLGWRSDLGSLALTIEGCESTCPKPFLDLYDDMWPRLLTWLIPALLLIGSVHFPRVGRLERLFVVLHFLGDPIDSMWSLATKAEVWNRFYRIALKYTPASGPNGEAQARALSAMLSAFEELTGDMTDVETELHEIRNESSLRLSVEDLDYILMETADELVDSRSNEVLRTALVIINYLWAVLAALIPEIGGVQSSQPGGRIGTAMFLSWLVTVVLLSNTLSGFTSRRTCLRIMERYYRALKGHKRDAHFFPNSPRLLARTSWIFNRNTTSSSRSMAAERARGITTADDDFIDSQPWNGGVYSYRTNKKLISSHSKEDWSPVWLLLLSMAPVVIASTSAFVIIWFTPTIGLGCRTLWVIGLTVGLLISPILTWGISKMAGGKFAWYLTIAKDIVIGAALVTVIILSSIGIFNSCFCWSGYYSRGAKNVYIDLDPTSERAYNLHHLYPAMVGVCLGLQLATYLMMYRVMRVGGRVFRPDEDDKMNSYRRIHGLGSSPSHSPSPSPSPSPTRSLSPEDGNRNRGMSYTGSPSSMPLVTLERTRHDSQVTDDGTLMLPEPAVSLQTPSTHLRYSPQLYSQDVASSSRAPTSVNFELGYGQSPEWKGSDQPLLGSPALPPRPRRAS